MDAQGNTLRYSTIKYTTIASFKRDALDTLVTRKQTETAERAIARNALHSVQTPAT